MTHAPVPPPPPEPGTRPGTVLGHVVAESRAFSEPVRVVVVDDQATIRLGLRMILDNEPDITVVGEAADGAQGVRMAHALRPDVVLMDVRMPHLNGIDAAAQISGDPALAGVRTLVLTTFDDDEYVYGALRAGAAGFLLKDADPEALVTAVHRVRAGDSLLDPGVTRRIIERYVELSDWHAGSGVAAAPRAGAGLELATPREREVLLAVARGLSNKEIGDELFLSEATVKSHVRSLLTKVGLTNRVQLVILAYEAELVRPGR
ncbi:response regulator transcription factor [Oerskovia turbata]|uniref:Response regulator transcription factor n=1 Tax=Oerskovia turbata TaxID=1713 RepID=A0A4Q1KR18_9CELL|nr:response regulator transcription factor [Oerskovia turbata]RXR22412.1 response regulator transcription factor [Oerskovia turbata]RXR32477.1 response regulator transcription factor [Oerskovia turbata]